MLRKFVPVIALLCLGACAQDDGRPTTSPTTPPPVNYQEAVRTYIKKTFFDPYSLMDGGITMPVWGRFGARDGWIVCFQGNGKNRMGAYVGLKRYGLLLSGDYVVEAMENARACEGAGYAPFKAT